MRVTWRNRSIAYGLVLAIATVMLTFDYAGASVRYRLGAVTQGETFFDGFSFGEGVTIDRITLHARSAPKGSDLQIDLMKNGSA